MPQQRECVFIGRIAGKTSVTALCGESGIGAGCSVYASIFVNEFFLWDGFILLNESSRRLSCFNLYYPEYCINLVELNVKSLFYNWLVL